MRGRCALDATYGDPQWDDGCDQHRGRGRSIVIRNPTISVSPDGEQWTPIGSPPLMTPPRRPASEILFKGDAELSARDIAEARRHMRRLFDPSRPLEDD